MAPIETVPLVQAIVRLPKDCPPDTTRVWFVPDDTPYFYWLIPESAERGALGVIASTAATRNAASNASSKRSIWSRSNGKARGSRSIAAGCRLRRQSGTAKFIWWVTRLRRSKSQLSGGNRDRFFAARSASRRHFAERQEPGAYGIAA